MFKNKTIYYHLLAAITVVIWGVTFVSTKILINEGLSSVEIFFYRFLLAYICLLIIYHKRLLANSWKDEFLLFLCGLTGGSIYFISENTALSITLASNVSLLICTAPIFAIVLSFFVYKTPIRRNTIIGSAIALFGVALVVFNGKFVFNINPLGDFLTICAAVVWAIYCLLLRTLSQRYNTMFITRKVFFYGVLSLFPYFLIHPLHIKTNILGQPSVYLNLLFLGLIASLLCYLMWNYTVKKLGVSKTANYIYIVPLVTIFTSNLILDEPITIVSLLGAFCIIGGLYTAEKHS